MIDQSIVITRLKDQLTYTIRPAREKQIVLSELSELPIIYVGYATIDSKDPTTPTATGYFEFHGEDLIQSFDIHICTTVTNFRTVWINTFKALVGYNPNTLAKNTSGLTYAQGGLMGLEDAKMWWMDRWRINFPTTNVEI